MLPEITINKLKTYFLVAVLIGVVIIVIMSLHKEFLYNAKVVELFTNTTVPQTFQEIITNNDNELLNSMDKIMKNQSVLNDLTNKVNKLKLDISKLGLTLQEILPKEPLDFY